MAELDADMTVSGPFGREDLMEESESQFRKGSLGSGKVLEDTCGIMGSTRLSMDVVERLDESFFSSGVLGSEGENLRDVTAGDEVVAVEKTIDISTDKVSVDDTNMGPVVEVTEEILSREHEVSGADDSSDSSLRESQNLAVIRSKKGSFDDEIQVREIEVDGEATDGNGNTNLTSETEFDVIGGNCLHENEKLKTDTINDADAGPVGVHGQSDSSVIDTQETLHISADNSSHESASILENALELEANMVTSDQPNATPVSNAVNFDEFVVTEEMIESCDNVGQNPQEMVLKKCTHDSVVDIYTCKHEEFVNEDILEEVESHVLSDAEFSEYFDGNTDDLCFEAEVEEKYTAEELQIEKTEHISEAKLGNEIEIKGTKETAPRLRTKVDLATHLLPEESKPNFSLSDLVWGKVKSHPWWPGQIYDPDDASEKAKKYRKKDSFLVAYFGDRTFAWNEASVLKPFWSSFSHIEKQRSSEVVKKAINSALNEVSRRIMLGLACFCIPNDTYSKIEYQMVESTGIREESNRRYGLDKSTNATFLKPNKLVEYIRALAESPSVGTDRLGLAIAKAQLLAFNQMRGYYSLPEFEYYGGLLERDDVDATSNIKMKSEKRISLKRKHSLKDGSHSRKKEKRLTELMGDEGLMEQDKRISFYAAKVSTTVSPIPKPSFKVGDCIRRAASQLTGSVSNPRNANEKLQTVTFSVENSSLDDTLLQLQILARDPLKGHSNGGITNFFSGFRDSIHLCQNVGKTSFATEKSDVGRKRKVSRGSPEDFEFDEVGDSYWTDMIVENYSEDQPIILDTEKSHKSSRKGYSKKNHEIDIINQIKQGNLPVDLVLNFPDPDSIPSEMQLNKTFRRFGPLKEVETAIDLEASHARVVFKRCSDAEVAFNSARKFNIFGPISINYQLNYFPSVVMSEELEDAALPVPHD